MPVGEAADMGHADDGTPLLNPRLFDSAEFRRNPHPYFRIMRKHYPVYHDKLHNCYYITRYDDARRCAVDDLGFNTIPKGIASTVLGNTQLELSGVEHRRRRGVFDRHLAGAALRDRIPAIERLAEELIADWDSGDEAHVQDRAGIRTVELGAAFCDQFPVRVVCEVLGFPAEARSQFNYWYQTMMAGFGGSDTAQQGLEARQDLEDYLEAIVQDRRQQPTYLTDAAGNPVREDLISTLSRTRVDGDYLSTEEITSYIALLVGGGGETTRGAIINMWYLMLQHPDQLAAVARDGSLWDAAFQETLRYAIPTGGMQPRHATFDIEVAGVTIPAGALVHIVNHSANRDERYFESPDRFDIFRNDLYTGKMLRSGFNRNGRCSHLAFGSGAHFCPGAFISHQEATACSRVLLRSMANPRLNRASMPKDIDGVGLAPIGLEAIRELWIDYDHPPTATGRATIA